MNLYQTPANNNVTQQHLLPSPSQMPPGLSEDLKERILIWYYEDKKIMRDIGLVSKISSQSGRVGSRLIQVLRLIRCSLPQAVSERDEELCTIY
jgi:hypothetical protein